MNRSVAIRVHLWLKKRNHGWTRIYTDGGELIFMGMKFSSSIRDYPSPSVVEKEEPRMDADIH